MVFREPNETERPEFWHGQDLKPFYNGKDNRQNSKLRTLFVEPAEGVGRCMVSIDRSVVELNFRVYRMEIDLEHSGKPKKTIGSVLSL